MLLSSMFMLCVAEEKVESRVSVFERSLHYTANGLRYWYSKEQGGIERLTSVPIDEVNCTK